MPVATAATRAHPRRAINDYRGRWPEAGARPPWRWLLVWGHSESRADRRRCADRPWPARQMSQAVVLDDRSRHAATADRCTSGYDELAGHRPCAAPEPLLPRRARAPVNALLVLAATASGRADPKAEGIPRPGLGGRRRSADEWSWTAGRAHRRPACSGGPRGGPRWRRRRLPPSPGPR
jgi:hypothetical protein